MRECMESLLEFVAFAARMRRIQGAPEIQGEGATAKELLKFKGITFLLQRRSDSWFLVNSLSR